MDVIEVRDLTKRYGETLAVDRITFTVAAGQTVGLLGGNGAGKTTTIAMLLGLLIPTAGTIRILGHDMAKDRFTALARMNFSSPYIALPHRLSVAENLRIYAHLYDVPAPERRIVELARELDLTELLDREAGTLSAGQKTRVALAKSLINRPDVLLLDEPTASLDPDTGDLVRSWIERYRAESGCVILLASHNMAEVERLCGHVLMMKQGRVVDRGQPRFTARPLWPRRSGGGVPRHRPRPAARDGGGMSGDGGRMGGSASLRRIWGMMYRHIALYRRSWPRLLELAYWPILQTLRLGLHRLVPHLARRRQRRALPPAACCWAACCCGRWRCGARWASRSASSRKSGRAISGMYSSARCGRGSWWRPCSAMSLLRMLTGVLPAILLAWLLYAFNLFSIGPVIVLLFANLSIMGWWVALGVVSLILRHGAGAEALAWSLLFGLTPFSAVFYPVSVLPAAIQPIALALPSAHVFEGMRAAMLHDEIAWGHLAWAFGLNAAWTAAAVLLFARQFRSARERGALLSIGE